MRRCYLTARNTLVLPALLTCVACSDLPDLRPNMAAQFDAIQQRASFSEIVTADDGRCFARMDQTTRTEMIEDLELITPETRTPDGALIDPAVYRTVTRPQTVPLGEARPFETLCPPAYTVERVATLQRALRARDAYAGPITGILDRQTSDAIRQFQRPEGIESSLIGIDVARNLGLVPTPLDTAGNPTGQTRDNTSTNRT